MTKVCDVIINNEAVTVVKFDDKEIQFPSIHKDVRAVIVKNDNGKYSIVDKMENESKSGFHHKKPDYKKTTIEKTENTVRFTDSTDSDK